MDELRALLGERGLPVTEIDRVIAVLEECDRARFAPGRADGDVTAALGTMQDTASDLIEVIEKVALAEEPGT